MAAMLIRRFFCFLVMLALSIGATEDVSPAAEDLAQKSPATQPAVVYLPHVQIDTRLRQIRVDCESLNVKMPLEFFCVVRGGQEHESVLRTDARPSTIHFGLLLLGLKPGEPSHYTKETDTWYPPIGPVLRIRCKFVKDGKSIEVGAAEMMRPTKGNLKPGTLGFVFDGSRILPDGRYAADLTGYVVSIVNFDLTMIDVSQLASNANETLEWQCNPDVAPPRGTPVTMIIEPTGETPTTQPSGIPGKKYNPGPGLGGGSK